MTLSTDTDAGGQMSTDTRTAWATPSEVSDVQLAFPANVMNLMPPIDECETALRALPDGGKKWVELQARWFFSGLPRTTEFRMAEGVDGNAAIRHLKAIQGSFEPQHEHKEAAVAYLASLWFTDYAFDGFGED